MWSQWAWTVVPTEKTRHIGRLAAPKPRGQHHSTQARPISTVESTAGCHLPDISTKTISGESIWSIQVAKSLKSHTICGGIGCIFWYCQRAWIARGWTSFNELDIDIPKYIIWYIYSIYIYICMYVYIYISNINLWMLNPHVWMQIHWVRPMCASCTPVKPPHTCKRMTSLTKSTILDLDNYGIFKWHVFCIPIPSQTNSLTLQCGAPQL
jgi:hypothetical protein